MALTSCKECGNDISTSAKICPKCGAVTPGPMIWPWIVGIPLVLFAAIIFIGKGIPEYAAEARRVRDICEQIAAPSQRYICDQQYQEAIAKGRAAAEQ
ncbi:zinc ribbon domain-containing protein [Burkholderia pseudomallei]